MLRKLIKGTALLTLAGLLTRFIGFFFRIYLSRSFGSEGLGVIQLLTPIIALSYAVCCAGLQTALSKHVAGELALGRSESAYSHLICALCLSLCASFVFCFFLLIFAHPIATILLHEKRVYPLIRILALSIPFSCIHACINGYYYGTQSALVPSLSQLLEQLVRVLVVVLFGHFSYRHYGKVSLSGIAFGTFFSEFAVSIYCLLCIRKHRSTQKNTSKFTSKNCKALLVMALPLSSNRVVISLLSSVETIILPQGLMLYGFSHSSALSVYGALTGIALPVILFPSAVINAFSVMLLPSISDAEGRGELDKLKKASGLSALCSIAFGFLCCILFLIFGQDIAVHVFQSLLAKDFIRTLSFLCPCLYLSATLSGILHGLGKTISPFMIQTFSLLIRLSAIFFAVPCFGMKAYLISLLLSQLLSAFLLSLTVCRTLNRMLP